MKGGILSIGTELTRGEIHNTNSTWLCQQFTDCGIPVVRCETVADDAFDIGQAFARLSSDCDFVVSTGGLGPTTDDITAQAIAQHLGIPLVRDAMSLRVIVERLEKAGRAVTESSCKQADFPAGATVLSNSYGTAPGFLVRTANCAAYFLPGVPREMTGMFGDHLAQLLLSVNKSAHIRQLRLRTFGLPESQINDQLAGIEQTFGVTLAYRAKFPTVEVKPIAVRASASEADQAVRAAADEVKARLGNSVFAEGSKDFPEAVGDLLRARGLTLGLAESCTGGLVAKLITQYPASDYFRGGIVCYDNEIKQRLLQVAPETLRQHGAVSEQTVTQMASGARAALGCDIALALSGVAGPSGGTEYKPVGLVHYAVATPDQVIARQRVFGGDREAIQARAAYAGLDLIRELLR